MPTSPPIGSIETAAKPDLASDKDTGASVATIPILNLQVAGRQAAQFGAQASRTFEGHGGSIGRSEDCDWVLSASGVSRMHARITVLGNRYYIEDRSTNGMLLNGAPMVHAQPSLLQDGDRVRIDTFELEVRIGNAERLAAAARDDRYEREPSHPRYAVADAAFAPPPLPRAEPLPTHLTDPSWSRAQAMERALPDPVPARPTVPPPSPFGSLGLLDDEPFPSRHADAAPVSLPRDPWPSIPPSAAASTLSAPAASAHPTPFPTPFPNSFPAPAAAPAPYAPFTSASPPPPSAAVPAWNDVPPAADALFRRAVDGLMEALRTRAEIKNALRVPVTIMQRSGNNPLKFAANADEALSRLLAPPGSGYLSAEAAFDEAFEELRCHQLAMVGALREAFDAMLRQIGPDAFEHDADHGSKRPPLLDFAGKGRHWERYREHFDRLGRDPDERYRRLFGDEFAKAYESQLSRLRGGRTIR